MYVYIICHDIDDVVRATHGVECNPGPPTAPSETAASRRRSTGEATTSLGPTTSAVLAADAGGDTSAGGWAGV